MRALALARAFLWLRRRELRHDLAGGRRDSHRRAAAWAGVAARVFVGVVGAGLAAVLALGAAVAGPALLGGGDSRLPALLLLRFALGFAVLLCVAFPLVQGARRQGEGRDRLRLLPISLRQLFGLEVVAAFAYPWVLVFVPALLVLAASIAAGSALAGLLVAVGALLFLAALVGLGLLASLVIELLLRDRRRAEGVALLGLLLWIGVALAPAVLERRGASEESDARGAWLAEVGERFSWWLQPIPSEALTRLVARGTAGRPAAAAASVGVLLAVALLVLGLAERAWRRVLASPATASRRGGRRRPASLPGALQRAGRTARLALGPAAAAVAAAQLRTALRTLQGKLALLAPPLVLLLLAVVMGRPGEGVPMLAVLHPGTQLAIAGPALALLALQSLLLNQLAADGPGLTLQLLAPITDRELVLGKAAALLLLAGASSALCVLVVATLQPGAPVWVWPAALLGGVGAAALLLPPALWLSLLLPKAVDLGKLGKAGQPHQLAGLLGVLLVAAVLAPPALLAGVGLVLFASPPLTLLLEAVWAALALLVARWLLRFSDRLVADRREALFLVLREG
ncbi:MAG TPA: hypothetical protein VMT16_12380 [Thermoanaerobaculia bacterium]|nr:hypothetical protein [Thermoanaerobaculia bacterium]